MILTSGGHYVHWIRIVVLAENLSANPLGFCVQLERAEAKPGI